MGNLLGVWGGQSSYDRLPNNMREEYNIIQLGSHCKYFCSKIPYGIIYTAMPVRDGTLTK